MIARSRSSPVLLLLFLLALMALSSSPAHAAIDSAGVMDTVTARYQAQAASWGGTIAAAATRLFWSLALISMVWTFGMMAFRKADLGEFFGELIKYVMFTGFFFFLLTNASAIATSIMNSLKQLGGDAAGMPGLTPSGIADVGFQIFSKVIDNSSVWEPVDTAIGAIVALLILGMLALVAINMVVLLVSGWILAYAGIFFLGFGGARWTSEIAINYYKTVMGIGASLMGMTLLVGIGQAVLTEYYTKMGDPTIKDLAVILVVAGLLLYLVNKIPPLIAGIITGASVGGASGMGSGGTGALVAAAAMAGAAAAGATAAVASAGTSAAGWGSAIKAAMQQGSESSGNGTGIERMPSVMSIVSNQSGDGTAAGTSTPFGSAMGDSGFAGIPNFNAGSGGARAATVENTGSASAQTNPARDAAGVGTESNPSVSPESGDFAAAAESGAQPPGKQSGTSALGALGSGMAAVARNKAGSMMDAAAHRVSQTAGGRVAAEINAPGTAAADRRNKADIAQSQSVAGKAKAARAFMATGVSAGGAPPAFTGDSLSAFSNTDRVIDADAEIASFTNRSTS